MSFYVTGYSSCISSVFLIEENQNESAVSLDLIKSCTEKPLESLEEGLSSEVFELVDVNAKINFFDCLTPNETSPSGIKSHLDLILDEGYYVITGTERLFFVAALSNPDKCKGFIGRDFNPRVKAYNDFNVMLLRISQNLKEYNTLSEDIKQESFNEEFPKRIELIKKHLLASEDMPKEAVEYYLKNLQAYGKLYFSVSKGWKNLTGFEGAKYYADELLFRKVQNYAKCGQIVSTVGNINDLIFLNKYNITLVDVSNIPDYILLNLNGGQNFHPRVVWTRNSTEDFSYFSYIHTSIDLTTSLKIDEMLQKFIPITKPFDNKFAFTLSQILDRACPKQNEVFDARPISYSEETFHLLHECITDDFFFFPNIGWLFAPKSKERKESLGAFTDLSISMCFDFSISQIEDMCQHPEIHRILENIVANWNNFKNLEHYFAFSKTQGWYEVFEKQIIKLINCYGLLNFKKFKLLYFNTPCLIDLINKIETKYSQ